MRVACRALPLAIQFYKHLSDCLQGRSLDLQLYWLCGLAKFYSFKAWFKLPFLI